MIYEMSSWWVYTIHVDLCEVINIYHDIRCIYFEMKKTGDKMFSKFEIRNKEPP